MKRKSNSRLFVGAVLTISLLASSISPLAIGQERESAQNTKPGKETGEQSGRLKEEGTIPQGDGLSKVQHKKHPKPDPIEEDDPDVPRLAQGRVNRKDYLTMREDQIALLRGLDDYKNFDQNPRVLALHQLEQQEAALKKAIDEGRVSPLISNASWTSIGPAPLPNGQTATVVTPVSGRVTCVAIHPTNPDTVYIGTAQGGLYRSLNGGQTWTPLLDSAQSLAIGAVTIDPVSPSTIFVGTGEGNLSLDSFFGVGIYRIKNADTGAPTVEGPFEARTNGGGGHAFAGTSINKIIIDPNNDNNMFVGNTLGGSGMNGAGICCGGTNPISGFVGLYFSANAQAATPTWVRVNPASLPGGGVAGVTDMVIEPGNANTLILNQQDFGSGAFNSGVFRSTNALSGGSLTATYTEVINYAGTQFDAKFAIYKQGGNPAVVYLATEEGGVNGEVRSSTDGGATWGPALAGGKGFCGGQCFYDIAIDVDPGATTATTDDILYLGGAAGSGILQKSTNGGATFSSSQTGLHADNHAVNLAPSNFNILYTGSDGGIYRSNDKAANWTSINNTGFNATQFESLALHPTDRYFTIGGTQDNGTPFQQPDNTWRRADFGDGGFARIDQTAADTTNVVMYHTYFNSTNVLIGFARVDSTNNANDGQWNFMGCNGGISNNGILCADNVLFYAPLELGPAVGLLGSNTVYFGTDRLYRSINKGVTAVLASQAPLVAGRSISAIAVSPQNDNVRIVGLTNGALFFTTTGLLTLTSLDPVGAGSVIPDKYIARIVFDPTNADTAYITLDGFTGASNHVWRATNLSTTPVLTNVSGSGGNALPDVPVNAFAIDPTATTNLYAGTDIGVFRSTDGGANWFPYGTGLPRVAVFDMAIQNPNRILRVATHGRGLWEIGLASTLSISGTVTNVGNAPVQGVVLVLQGSTPAPLTTATDASGNYTFNGLAVGGNYTVRPQHGTESPTLNFYTPALRTFTDVSANQTGVNFVGATTGSGTTVNTGNVLISEFRLRGPNGPDDEFVELYNNTDSPITVAATDGTAGWRLNASTGSLPAIIPNGTVIPARGHYLLAGSAYSLSTRATPDLYLQNGISDDVGLALARSASTTAAADRLDSVGFTGVSNAFFFEGTTLTPLGAANTEYSFVRKLTTGFPQDTNNNAADFALISTSGATIGSTASVLGAPGPENLSSPIQRNATIRASAVDPSVNTSTAPNRERNSSDTGANKTFGTLILRRRFTNNTGQTVTKLRFRVVDITTLNSPGGPQADLRVLDSSDQVVSNAANSGTIAIKGTTTDQPPTLTIGGGLNSTVTVLLPNAGLTSLSAGTCPGGQQCTIDVQFVIGVMQSGNYRFFINVEALP